MIEVETQKQFDWGSRKYRSSWILTVIFLGLFTIPKLAAFLITLFWKQTTFDLITSTELITFLSLVWAAYFGANVVQHHQSFSSKQISADTKIEIDSGAGAGGQPKESIGKEP